MAYTEAQKRATTKYLKNNVKRAVVAFYPAEAELWEWLDSQPNKAGYIKRLIREDMERSREVVVTAKDAARVGKPAGTVIPYGDAPEWMRRRYDSTHEPLGDETARRLDEQVATDLETAKHIREGVQGSVE